MSVDLDNVRFILRTLGKPLPQQTEQTPARLEGTLEWDRILRVADLNKLSYALCSAIAPAESPHQNKIVNRVLEEGERNLAKQRRTLEFISDALDNSGIDFLLIKTHKGNPYVTDDIDILVKEGNSRSAAASFEDAGATLTGGRFMVPLLKTGVATPAYTAAGTINVDIYDGMPWSSLRCVDENFLWSNPRSEKFAGISCYIPSVEADLLTLLATSLFTDGKITLLDILYANSLFERGMDLTRPTHQAEKYGWYNQFASLLAVLNNIEQIVSGTSYDALPITLPYRIPSIHTFSALQSLLRFALKCEPKRIGRGLVMITFHFFIGRLYISTLGPRLKENPGS